MSKSKELKWIPIINQRKYSSKDSYKEGDNQVYLECPACGQRYDYDLKGVPTICPACRTKINGIEVTQDGKTS